jgi:putative lipoic acid-binding regulatory protein
MTDEPDTLLKFPCRFPIKVMGEAHPELLEAVQASISRHVADPDSVTVTQRASSGGKYMGVTIVLTAVSQEQLDALYRDLGQCSRVRMVL